jgi:sensor domain CHASE-containing protein
LAVVRQQYLVHGLERIEQNEASKDISRAGDAVHLIQTQLSEKSNDWSSWDDTYTFAQNHNKAYIKSNLQPAALGLLKADYVLIYNRNHQLVDGIRSEATDDKTPQLSAALRQELIPASPLLQHSDVDDVHQGLLALPEGILMIVTRPILTSEGKGPIMGTLVMGQYLTPLVQLNLSDTMHVNLEYVPTTDGRVRHFVARGLKPEDTWSEPVNELQAVGYEALADIHGKPTIVARVGLSREITSQGTHAVDLFFLVMVIVAAVVTCIILLFVNLLVVRRLWALSRQLSSFKNMADASRRLKVSGTDEIGRLGASINTMLSQLQDAYRLEQRNQTLKAEATAASQALQTERGSVEDRVRQRTAELEQLRNTLEEQVNDRTKELNQQLTETQRMNDLMVDRELKMVELKQEISRLKGRLKPPETTD